MSQNQFEVGAGYEVALPPLLGLADGKTHRLARFFTVLTVEDSGIAVYDGAYESGLASVFLPTAVLEGLSVERLSPAASVAEDLAYAISKSAAEAQEQRKMVAIHGDADKSVDASHRFFAQFLSGQIKGLAAQGKINPDLAVAMCGLAQGVDVD